MATTMKKAAKTKPKRPAEFSTTARHERARFRQEFGITRRTLSRMTGLSERTLATWESGANIGDAGARTMTQIQRLLREMSEVIQKNHIAAWLETPSDGFGNLKPIEVLERGEIDRVWRALYFLGSGTSS